MESKDELKTIDIKYCTCYYFNYKITDRDILVFDNVLFDEDLYKKIRKHFDL